MKHHRKFNFIFFIDQGPTRTWTLDSRYFFALVGLVGFSVAALIGLFVLTSVQADKINNLEALLKENKEILFSYKVRVDDIYSKYYAQNSFKPKPKQNTPSLALPSEAVAVINKDLPETKSGKSKIELASMALQDKVNTQKSQNSGDSTQEVDIVDFEGIKVMATSESLQANFLIKNLTTSRLEGRFTIVAEFLDEKGTSHYVAHPDRTSLSPTGVPKQLENGTLFNIQRFKPTTVSVDKPIGLGGKFTKATLYAAAGGTTVKDEVIIDTSASGVVSKKGLSAGGETH